MKEEREREMKLKRNRAFSYALLRKKMKRMKRVTGKQRRERKIKGEGDESHELRVMWKGLSEGEGKEKCAATGSVRRKERRLDQDIWAEGKERVGPFNKGEIRSYEGWGEV